MAARKWINDHPKSVILITLMSLLILSASCLMMSLPSIMAKREQKKSKQANAERIAKRKNPVVKGKLIFEKIPIKVRSLSGNIYPLEKGAQILKCGESLDVLWSANTVLLMRQRGLFEQVLLVNDVHFSDLKWDGENIWLAVPERGIWILDTSGKIVTKIGSETSLPPAERGLLLHLINPGRMFAAGSFGPYGRGWCAIVEFKNGKASVNVFHEATRVWTGADNKQEIESDPFVVFTPYWIRESQTEGQRTLHISRCEEKYKYHHLLKHPLEVNLGKMSVSVSSLEMSSVRAPASKLEYNGKIYVPGRIWYCINEKTGQKDELITQGELPDPYGSLSDFWVSAHYGPVGWRGVRELYQIRITDDEHVIVEKPPPPKTEYFHTFAFEDENGPVSDTNALRLTYLAVERKEKAKLQYKYSDYSKGGYFPLGTYNSWREGMNNGAGKVIKTYKFEPIQVTENSPTHLVFKAIRQVKNEIVFSGQVVDALTGKPLPGAFVMAGDDRNLAHITSKEWEVMHKLPDKLSTGDPVLGPVRAASLFAMQAILRTGPEGRFEMSIDSRTKIYEFVAFEENYLNAVVDRNDLGSGNDGRIEIGLMPLFPAAKIMIHPFIKEFNDGNPCVEAANVNILLHFRPHGQADTKEETAFFSKYGGYSRPTRTPTTRPNMNDKAIYYVPAGFALELEFNMPWEYGWTIPDIPNTINLKQGEFLDLGSFKFEPQLKLLVKVVTSAGYPIKGVRFKNLSEKPTYYGRPLIKTDDAGIAALYVKSDSRQEILIDYSELYADLQHTLIIEPGVEKRIDKGFTVVLLENGGFQTIKSFEPSKADFAKIVQSQNKVGDGQTAVTSKLNEVIFTTGITEENNPLNNLIEISINEETIYVYTTWVLSLEYHEIVIKTFDGAGNLVKEYQNDRLPYNTNWRLWFWHNIDRKSNKPGKWKYEVYLDSKKVAEKYLTVLP